MRVQRKEGGRGEKKKGERKKGRRKKGRGMKGKRLINWTSSYPTHHLSFPSLRWVINSPASIHPAGGHGNCSAPATMNFTLRCGVFPLFLLSLSFIPRSPAMTEAMIKMLDKSRLEMQLRLHHYCPDDRWLHWAGLTWLEITLVKMTTL